MVSNMHADFVTKGVPQFLHSITFDNINGFEDAKSFAYHPDITCLDIKMQISDLFLS